MLAAVSADLQAAPLFDSNDALSVTIEAPMRELLRRRHSNPEFDAALTYTDAAGIVHQIDFRLTTPGRSRLESCSFPPLRLIFDPNTTKGTIFEDQRRLKMVTQCKRGGRGANWVLQEFGIYRAYNVITDYSYRVRPLEVTFRDTKSAKWQRFQGTFLIESTGEAARRLERDSIEPPEIEPEQFSVLETTHQLLFQYLIGNTDFFGQARPVVREVLLQRSFIGRAGSGR